MNEYVANTITGSVSERRAASQSLKRWFLMALLLATWLPIAFFILLAPPGSAGGGLGGIKTAFLFLGGAAHVPATLLFYTDREFAEISPRHPWRYFYVTLFLIVVTGLVFAFTPFAVQAFVLLLFWGWQAYPYGRQNTGMF